MLRRPAIKYISLRIPAQLFFCHRRPCAGGANDSSLRKRCTTKPPTDPVSVGAMILHYVRKIRHTPVLHRPCVDGGNGLLRETRKDDRARQSYLHRHPGQPYYAPVVAGLLDNNAHCLEGPFWGQKQPSKAYTGHCFVVSFAIY